MPFLFFRYISSVFEVCFKRIGGTIFVSHIGNEGEHERERTPELPQLAKSGGNLGYELFLIFHVSVIQCL
jgi:hypothetical protein